MIHIFCSYAPEDDVLEARLEADLKGLGLQGLITSFSSRCIVAGNDRQRTIEQNLDAADVILLLISPAYVRSKDCHTIEVRNAVERHHRKETVVIPVLARPAFWEGAPFAGLKALPRNDKPITAWANKDLAWLDVIRGIVAAIVALEARRQGEKQSA